MGNGSASSEADMRGLLLYGPHNLRDVLATHILKQSGSYGQASYAIRDTPEIVAKHYGRFLSQDMTALAPQVLNQVWAARYRSASAVVAKMSQASSGRAPVRNFTLSASIRFGREKSPVDDRRYRSAWMTCREL